MTDDKILWGKELFDKCTDRYTDPRESRDIQQCRIDTLRAVKSTQRLPTTATFEARALMSRGKSAGGESCLVVEMLLALPFNVVMHIARLFSERFEGVKTESIESWVTILLCFIPKVKIRKDLLI